MCTLIAYIFLYVSPYVINALIQDEPMPKELYECFHNQTSNIDITTTPAYSVQIHCINYYLTKTYQERFYHDLDPSVVNWIQTLERNLNLRRRKRQAQFLRRRREIRTLTEEERRAFFNAIVALKEDVTVRPNMYDALAGLHNAQAIQAAHFGPGFLGWHRYFLYIFEEALRTKDPTVALPYWDSTFDFNMDTEDPINSVMWSDIFLGNGNGLVTSGPFANWRTNNGFLTRNIGSPGALMTPGGIQAVLSQSLHRDITQPTATGLNDLEGQHNNVHAWIGGDMNGLTTSAFDPVFFLHHCFIDYIWEQFRFQQFGRGVNPQNDYPNTRPQQHWPWALMVNLGRLRNVDGYHNAFTQFVYEYEGSPTCPNCGGSLYLECDVTRQVCVSTTSREFRMGRTQSTIGNAFGAPLASLMANGGMFFRTNTRELNELNANIGEKFVPNMIDPRTQKRARRVKRAIYNPNTKTGIKLTNNNIQLTSAGHTSTDPFSSISIRTPTGFVKSSITNAMSPSTNVKFPSSSNLQTLFSQFPSNSRIVQSGLAAHQSSFKEHPYNSRQTSKNNNMNSLPHFQALESAAKGMPTAREISPHSGLSMQRPSINSQTTYSKVKSMFMNDLSDDILTTRKEFLDNAIQNNFVLDGVPDVSKWAFTAVKIIYRRPPGSSFNCKLIKGGIIFDGKDFYSPEHYINLQRQVNTGNPATYPKPVRSGSGASKIFIQSDGLSYQGKHIDYAIIDERQPISEAVSYVAFKNPKLGASKAYISAYDANGRICQPRCLIPGTNPPQYKICSGVVSVSDSYPKMFGDTYGDAVMNRYSFENSHCPTNIDKEIFFTFYCDYENDWPWINYPHY